MRVSVLTTITNPDKRQDKWREALTCYKDFADEVVVVDGSSVNGRPEWKDFTVDNFKIVYLSWPYEWNWIELPRHLNAGLRECTGDWVVKLDIDQFIYEDEFKSFRDTLSKCPPDTDVVTFQKMSMTYGKKYYQKGPTPIAFRRKENIKIGKNKTKRIDLCFPIDFKYYEKVDDYELPVGKPLKMMKGRQHFWNYDYFFKTKEFTQEEFFRFSRAYHRFYKSWEFGKNKEDAFDCFLNMMKGRHERAPYTYELKDHPKWIRKAVENIKPEQFGYNAWNLLQ